MIKKTNNFDKDYQLSENFKLGELRSPDNFVIWNLEIDQFVSAIQCFRAWYNRPMNLSSWYRTPEYNKKIGGATNSMHLYALAIDCPYPFEFHYYTKFRKDEFTENIIRKWESLCKGFLGDGGSIEICDRHFHLDFRKWSDKKFHVYYGKSV